MKKKMLTADKYIDCCCNPWNEYGEQTSSLIGLLHSTSCYICGLHFTTQSNEQWSTFPALLQQGMFVLSAPAKLYFPK